MRSEEIRALRKAEAQALMRDLGPLLNEAAQRIQQADALEDAVGDQDLPTAMLSALGNLSAATTLVDESIRSMAIYLAVELRVPRRTIAQQLNVTTTTLHRWIRDEEEHRKNSDEK